MKELNESPRCEIPELVAALREQTKAINGLANSNAMLAQAIMEQIDGEEQPQTHYLDGSKLG